MRLWLAGLVLALASCADADPRLVSKTQIVDDGISTPLSTETSDPERGRDIFINRDRGHCVLCHAVEGLEAEFQGNVGPDLSAVAERLSSAQLRLRIVDYQIVRPGALMPSYYRIHDLYQVADQYQDEPILTATEVEDLVAYLSERR